MGFVRVSTLNGYRPPHPIHIKGYGRLRYIQLLDPDPQDCAHRFLSSTCTRNSSKNQDVGASWKKEHCGCFFADTDDNQQSMLSPLKIPPPRMHGSASVNWEGIAGCTRDGYHEGSNMLANCTRKCTRATLQDLHSNERRPYSYDYSASTTLTTRQRQQPPSTTSTTRQRQQFPSTTRWHGVDYFS